MSIRESKLCDSPRGFGPNGDLCPFPAVGTCNVCKADRCEGHYGQGMIKIAVESISPGVNASLGSTKVRICETCTRIIRASDSDESMALDVAPLIEPTCKLIAAIVTATALETKP